MNKELIKLAYQLGYQTGLEKLAGPRPEERDQMNKLWAANKGKLQQPGLKPGFIPWVQRGANALTAPFAVLSDLAGRAMLGTKGMPNTKALMAASDALDAPYRNTPAKVPAKPAPQPAPAPAAQQPVSAPKLTLSGDPLAGRPTMSAMDIVNGYRGAKTPEQRQAIKQQASAYYKTLDPEGRAALKQQIWQYGNATRLPARQPAPQSAAQPTPQPAPAPAQPAVQGTQYPPDFWKQPIRWPKKKYPFGN